LLSGSIAHNGSKVYGSGWTVVAGSANIESYTSRVKNVTPTLGTRYASVSPPSGYEAALAKLFVVVAATAATANTDTEPGWATTDGGTTTDGGVTYRTIPKFPTIGTFTASTAYSVGQLLKPSATSMREYLVTVAGTPTAAPTWTSYDTPGVTVSPTGGATLMCLTNVLTYANNTVYGMGDLVKPTAASTEEYLCVVAGTSDTTALNGSSPAVGTTFTRGTAQFKRIV
jgi:hypothetical protein